MKKLNYLIIIIFLMLVFPNIAFAACSDTDRARMNPLASNVKFTYEIEDRAAMKYKIMASGLTGELAAYTKIGNETAVFDHLTAENGIVSVSGFSPQSYNVDIYISTATCGEKIRTVTVNIPKYNKYSEREECNDADIKKFALCDPYYQFEITDENFISRYNSYLKSVEKNKDGNNTNTTDSNAKEVVNNITKFFQEYYLYMIGGVVVIAVATFIIIRNKKRGELG